jgi:hypothetical protein
MHCSSSSSLNVGQRSYCETFNTRLQHIDVFLQLLVQTNMMGGLFSNEELLLKKIGGQCLRVIFSRIPPI